MKFLSSIVALCLCGTTFIYAAVADSTQGNVPPEIENPECLGINKQPFHASLMPYGSLKEALITNRHASTLCRSLNGKWKFNWVSWPQKRPVDFYKTNYDVSGWKDIPVPSNWQIEGYGTPFYRNNGYTFQRDFPRVMSTPPENFTAFKERNPVGSYRRDFDVPATWSGGRIFINFDGVDAGFFLWINGKKVGYSVNSRNAAEFDITDFVKPGKNMIAAEVYQYTSGSYLEDQDMWRLSGIFRNVTMWSAPNEHIRDFFIKTDLDEQYRNATLDLSAKVKNYSTTPTANQKLVVSVYDGDKIISTKTTDAPVLKPGEETTLSIKLNVNNPLKWTAETPNLYTTVIQLKQGDRITETISSRTGFREIEIKGRVFMVNGVPIKLRGVNRHENWPDVGHAITEAQMRRDLEVIKQGNCNHVRTCHYSDDPRWYELCDEYGIYLVAEANLECHGLMNRFNDEPLIKAAIIDRQVANVENFKNHPSVIIWSLGNECGTGGSNFAAALAVVKSIDATRPTHYEGFGIGDKNPAGIDSRMYSGIQSVEQSANDDKLTKPYYLCEYTHAMFNSMGSLKEYNDLFDKYPALLGGAIWEFQDQGIWNKRDPKHPILAFGGGFGDFPNDHYFIHKGVVASDRSAKPHFPEMKHVYQWIKISADDLAKGVIKVRNKYQFINLDGFKANWAITKNGIQQSAGIIDISNIAPLTEKTIKLPYQLSKPEAGAVYYLRVSFTLATDQLWAKSGYEVASEQMELPFKPASKSPIIAKLPPVSLLTDDKSITVNGSNFSILFNKITGSITSLKRSGTELLTEGGGPQLHLWRAPHQKDDMWAYKDWDAYGLKELKWNTGNITARQISASEVSVIAELSATGKKNFSVTHHVVYSITGDGSIKVNNDVTSSDPKLNVARMGVRLFLNKNYEQFNYFGRGPMENYSDRKTGSDVGIYGSTVAQQLTPYEKPMECGNHEDVRWATVTNTTGSGLKVIADSNILQVSALPYSDEEMTTVEYKIDLPASKATVLCISYKTLGVGSNGCGPTPLPPYRVYAEPSSFTYQIQLLSKQTK